MGKHLLLILITLLTTAGMSFAQQGSERLIKGKIIETVTQEPLIGATVLVKGSTIATSAGLDGTFKLKAPSGSQVLIFSFIGYVPKQITVGDGNQNIGEIKLNPGSSSIKEVTITGDVAIDRRTPIAVTSIGPEYIEEH